MRRRVRSGKNDAAGAEGGTDASSERLSLRAAAVGVSGDGVTGRLIRFQREPEKESPERLASRIAALKTAETCIRAQREELEERLRSKRSRSRGDRRG